MGETIDIEKSELEKLIKKKLEEEIKRIELDKDLNKDRSPQPVNRREFLKKAGLGLGGLAALTLPGKALDIKDDSFNVYTGDSSSVTRYLSVDGGGVDVPNGDLTVSGSSVALETDVSGIQSSSDVDHDSTSGGTRADAHHNVFEPSDYNPEADTHDQTTSSDINHNDTQGGTSGNPHSDSASMNHGNEAHSNDYITEDDIDSGGEDITRVFLEDSTGSGGRQFIEDWNIDSGILLDFRLAAEGTGTSGDSTVYMVVEWDDGSSTTYSHTTTSDYNWKYFRALDFGAEHDSKRVENIIFEGDAWDGTHSLLDDFGIEFVVLE